MTGARHRSTRASSGRPPPGCLARDRGNAEVGIGGKARPRPFTSPEESAAVLRLSNAEMIARAGRAKGDLCGQQGTVCATDPGAASPVAPGDYATLALSLKTLPDGREDSFPAAGRECCRHPALLPERVRMSGGRPPLPPGSSLVCPDARSLDTVAGEVSSPSFCVRDGPSLPSYLEGAEAPTSARRSAASATAFCRYLVIPLGGDHLRPDPPLVRSTRSSWTCGPSPRFAAAAERGPHCSPARCEWLRRRGSLAFAETARRPPRGYSFVFSSWARHPRVCKEKSDDLECSPLDRGGSPSPARQSIGIAPSFQEPLTSASHRPRCMARSSALPRTMDSGTRLLNSTVTSLRADELALEVLARLPP